MMARAVVGVLICCALALLTSADSAPNQRGGGEDRDRGGRRGEGRDPRSDRDGAPVQPRDSVEGGQLPNSDYTVTAGALKSLLDSFQPTTPQGSSPACKPYQLPAGVASLQELCKRLSVANDTEWDERYRSAAGPAGAAPLPLQGCVLGCIVGAESYQRGLVWGAGAWSGKCIRGSSVMNLLSPLPPGGMLNVVDTFNWAQGIPATEQFPGDVSTGPSWWDAYNSLGSTGRLGNAWTITYDDVDVPETTANSSLLVQTTAMYAKLVRGTRDELRYVEPGMMLGQVFRRPQTYLNPLPLPANSGIRFVLLQTCDQRGGFATGGNQRVLAGGASV